MLFNSVEFIIFYNSFIDLLVNSERPKTENFIFNSSEFYFYAYHRIPYLLLLIYSYCWYFCAIKIFILN